MAHTMGMTRSIRPRTVNTAYVVPDGWLEVTRGGSTDSVLAARMLTSLDASVVVAMLHLGVYARGCALLRVATDTV